MASTTAERPPVRYWCTECDDELGPTFRQICRHVLVAHFLPRPARHR